jgi:hypothetical protein
MPAYCIVVAIILSHPALSSMAMSSKFQLTLPELGGVVQLEGPRT